MEIVMALRPKRVTYVDFTCPCGKPFHVATSQVGHRIPCPDCHSYLTVPTLQPAPIPVPVPRRWFSWDDGFSLARRLVARIPRLQLRLHPLGSTASWTLGGYGACLAAIGVVLTRLHPATPEANQPGSGLVLPALVTWVVALTLPTVLSRLRFLSFGRWLTMAVASGVLACLAFVSLWAIAAVLFGQPSEFEQVHPGWHILRNGVVYTVIAAALSVFGCLLAAAVHPRATTWLRSSGPIRSNPSR